MSSPTIVFEQWKLAGQENEGHFEVTMSVDLVPQRGAEIDVPDLGRCRVLSVRARQRGGPLEPGLYVGQKIVRLDLELLAGAD